MAVERECRADRAEPHHLEACAVDERRPVYTACEELRRGNAVDRLVGPDELDGSENIVYEIARSGRAEAPVDERAGSTIT